MGTLASGMTHPTGMTLDVDGSLLVLSGQSRASLRPTTGASLGIVASGVDGGISGGTFLALVPNPAVDAIFGNGFDPG